MKIVASIAYIAVGIGCLYMFACMLKDVYNDIKQQVEEEVHPYTLEVDVDPETGQRTSTIIKD